MDDIETYLDESWINDFEINDKAYDMCNQEENTSIKIKVLYVNDKDCTD